MESISLEQADIIGEIANICTGTAATALSMIINRPTNITTPNVEVLTKEDLLGNADMLIIGGTSLAVYPAAGLIDYYRGNKLVLINKSATPKDGRADLLIQDGLGNVFSKIEL